ncbi:hypothetical protein WA026_023176 [Henosepilachna vigintioctopunctata]|uniref:Uncharacterized protein n=1 Tax=Henosepilachna vigintioctopunctata TaxID=420089 RepID=A0AAW1UI74_9CUCU
MKKLTRRQQKRFEFIQSLQKMHRMQEIMDYSLEDLWQDYNELLIQFEQDPESVDTPGFLCSVLNKKEQYHQQRQTSLSQDVDNKVDQENNETVEQSDKEDEEQPFNNHSTDPYFIDVKL